MGSDVEDGLNVDQRVVDAFGDEWSRFNNADLAPEELRLMFDGYAAVFPWAELPEDAEGFDAGCGSGRWATFFAPRVGRLHCIDASSEALQVARKTLANHANVSFRHEDLSSIGLGEESCDFGYSLGVLHHIPDTADALGACVRTLRPGAPFLVYLYYNLEDAGPARRRLLQCVSVMRAAISRLPRILRFFVADLLAVSLYWPLARFGKLVERTGRDPSRIPLFQYRNRSFSVMRNDALDRFGTRLEKRYSRLEIVELLEGAGLVDIEFSPGPPWWVAVGRKARQ